MNNKANSISICQLRDIGILNNQLEFYDNKLNLFNELQQAAILSELKTVVNSMSVTNYLCSHSAKTIFPTYCVVSIIRDFRDKLIALQDKNGIR